MKIKQYIAIDRSTEDIDTHEVKRERERKRNGWPREHRVVKYKIESTTHINK